MALEELFWITGSVLFSLGGASVVVLGLVKYLGGIWAHRLMEADKATQGREQELLVRRRNVYAKLAQSLRVFLDSSDTPSPEDRKSFLNAYDEASLWATEEVISSVALFLDMNAANNKVPGCVSIEALRAAYSHCINAMRKDSGFPGSEYQHRVVSF